MTKNNTQDLTIIKKQNTQRTIGIFEGKTNGSTLIFLGGIHGNEASGVAALEKVFSALQGKEAIFKGKVFALRGNIKALNQNVRFLDLDLNRQFTKAKIKQLKEDTLYKYKEQEEQIELLEEIEQILNTEKGPFYFFDLHTTSSETIPFITVNDSLLNRKYTKQYPVPLVLGIEEYLEGPLLSYINELGYIAFGFEGGQHTSKEAINNHISFIYLSLAFTGCLTKSEANFDFYYNNLFKNSKGVTSFFEITYRHLIKESDAFKMNKGFKNFQPIKSQQQVATDTKGKIKTPFSGKIFMPLYQGKGEDGFFIIRKIPKFFLWLSKKLRAIKMDHFLVILPGINWGYNTKDTLLVNRKVARFFAKDFFHLLGYRSSTLNENQYIMKNREAFSKNRDYRNEPWY